MSQENPRVNRRAISASDAVRIAETYPDVALHTLFLELSHAEQEVPLGTDDRAEAIAMTIQVRLNEAGRLRRGEDPQ